MKKIILITALFSGILSALAQQEQDSIIQLGEVLLKSTRVSDNAPYTHTNIKANKIESKNLGQDLPILLSQLPSVVTTSDAGAGVGYTGMRIRGSDATRINVTLNGIPFNDAESQGTYWVDLPDFISSVDDIQLQRGVGTSTNGPAAFGATLSLRTAAPTEDAYAETAHSYGSYNTRKHNLQIGTGIHNGFYAEGRLSRIYSDGYIDRAFSDLHSYFTEAGFQNNKTHIKTIIFGGHERTYQSWYGTPECVITGDETEIENFIERNYLDEEEAENLRNSGRTYNHYTYDNQVDDYTQNHYQLHISHLFLPGVSAQVSFNYTRGDGYYEEYKKGENLSEYFINPDTDEAGDVIRRKWLNNDFYAFVYSVNYHKNRWDASFGGGYNYYDGKHVGRIIWNSFPQTLPIDTEYYNNTGVKKDFNMYAKASYQLSDKWGLFADTQIRLLNYNVEGLSSKLKFIRLAEEYIFFNPKAGVSYKWKPGHSAYFSAALSHREPNRDDLVKQNLNPVPEKMLDLESGYKLNNGKLKTEINLYFMGYKDQLILTGALNDVGDPIRQNVEDSYRTGIEIQAQYYLSDKWKIQASGTFSRNKIREYKHYVYDTQYDPDTWETIVYEPVITTYNNTDISFSPSVIAGGNLTYSPLEDLDISLISKYVGKQYLDNTSSESKRLDAYWVNHLNLDYTWKPEFVEKVKFHLLLNNIFNRLYESNGYTYSYYYRPVGSDQPVITENFYYPQAGFHLLGGISLHF